MINCTAQKHSLRKKCPYSELFWSVFSHIRIQEITDQKTPDMIIFLRSVNHVNTMVKIKRV